jgi:nicotinate-nucleotide adenylyltransferase
MSKAAEKERDQESGTKRIGIFGGSFDPVHEGHIHLAKLAKDAADLDEIWFLPCRISPHKADEPPTPAADRVKWLETAVRGLPWAKIETAELKLEPPSYSYLTLEILNSEYPGNQWFWIMGGDQWAALDRWKQPEAIAKLASFIVLARNGVTVIERPGYRLIAVSGEHPASSSEIRLAIARAESEIPYLDPEVERLMLAGRS